MSASGAKVMALRSIEVARSYGVRLHVRSTFEDGEGTWIGEEDEQMLEKAIISGVTHDTSEAKVSIIGVPDRPGVAAQVFRALADAGVNIDMIVQNVSQDGEATISFTLPKTDLAVAEPILDALRRPRRAPGRAGPDIAKVSLIGAGMKSHPGVAADMFDALAEAGINIEIISTSSIRDLLRGPRRRGRARRRRPSTSGSSRSPRSASMPERPTIGVVGATGAVGTVTLELLARARLRERPRLRLRALRRARQLGGGTRRGGDAGGALARRRRHLPLLRRHDGASRELVPHAVRGGAVAVDKSSAYRLEPGIPLVVPEVNGGRALEHEGIIANPNCCTIPLTVRAEAAARGGRARARARRDLPVGLGRRARRRWSGCADEPPDEHDLRMDWDFDGEEFDEESKLRVETRKIMELPDLPIQATCVRVPVMVGHAEAVWIETEEPLSAGARRARCSRRRRRCARRLPSPGKAAGIDDVLVGRIRRDPTVENGLALFLASDNLRKGAALNAIQIAELVLAARPRGRVAPVDVGDAGAVLRPPHRRELAAARAGARGSPRLPDSTRSRSAAICGEIEDELGIDAVDARSALRRQSASSPCWRCSSGTTASRGRSPARLRANLAGDRRDRCSPRAHPSGRPERGGSALADDFAEALDVADRHARPSDRRWLVPDHGQPGRRRELQRCSGCPAQLQHRQGQPDHQLRSAPGQDVRRR